MELKLKRHRYKSFKISRKEEGDRYSKFKIRFRIFVDQAKVNHLIIKNFSRKPARVVNYVITYYTVGLYRCAPLKH